MSITANTDTSTIQQLQAENHSLKTRVQQLEVENRQLKTQLGQATERADQEAEARRQIRERRDHLAAERTFTKALAAVPEKKLSGNQKHALTTALDILALDLPRTALGLVEINLEEFGKRYGVSKQTAGDNLRGLSQLGLLNYRSWKTQDEDTKLWQSHSAIGPTDVLTSLDPTRLQETVSAGPERNRGGKREQCPDCGSEALVDEVWRVCTHCGAKHKRRVAWVNGPPSPDDPKGSDGPSDAPTTEPPTDHHTNPEAEPQAEQHEPRNDAERVNLTSGSEAEPYEPDIAVTPAAIHTPSIQSMEHHTEGVSATPSEWLPLLLAVAGSQRVIKMLNGSGQDKYVYLPKPGTITPALAKQHVAGTITLGADLRHPGDQCGALCFDRDCQEEWARLQDAARELAPYGYQPLLEPSPGRSDTGLLRGGHLWIIFDGLVDIAAAQNHVRSLAPALRDVSEFWPRPGDGGNRVRLPGGRYRHPDGTSEWCVLHDVAGTVLATDGPSALAAIATHLTPASIVPPLPASEPSPAPTPAPRPRRAPLDEAAWLARYGDRPGLLFRLDQAEVIRRFNERVTCAELLPLERGSDYAWAVWRGERNKPSVHYTQADTHWTDFGASAELDNGKQDGGDAFELLCRLESMKGRTKTEVIRERMGLEQASLRVALGEAARLGQALPAEVAERLTEGGRAMYRHLLRQAGHQTAA